MTLIANYKKQPRERKDYDVHYDEWLALDASDSLDEVEAEVFVLSGSAENPLRVERVDISATVAKLWVSGGVSGASYKVEITAHTQRGRIDQSEIKFSVKEV